ncbi:MAG TPA: hypothetical protein VEA60_13400 [Allosphingosinicella sp.]|nr:hypothetical protein [Allosphingosinicella sp.]
MADDDEREADQGSTARRVRAARAKPRGEAAPAPAEGEAKKLSGCRRFD